jgi:hypothetical protein
MASMVESYLIADIIAKNNIVGTTPSGKHIRECRKEDFYQLSNRELYFYLQRALQPRGSKEFADALVKYVHFDFDKHLEVNIKNMDKFAEALYKYRQQFEMFMDFMAFDNLNNLPLCNNKQNGLIKIFLSKIPSEYGINVFSTFTASSFYTMDQFLDLFYTEVRKHVKYVWDARIVESLMGQSEPGYAANDDSDYEREQKSGLDDRRSVRSSVKVVPRYSTSSSSEDSV